MLVSAATFISVLERSCRYEYAEASENGIDSDSHILGNEHGNRSISSLASMTPMRSVGDTGVHGRVGFRPCTWTRQFSSPFLAARSYLIIAPQIKVHAITIWGLRTLLTPGCGHQHLPAREEVWSDGVRRALGGPPRIRRSTGAVRAVQGSDGRGVHGLPIFRLGRRIVVSCPRAS